MKRFHVHVGVASIEESVRFYSALFGAAPTMQKTDYAKWMIDEPRINFAISQRGSARAGVNHLGMQVESADELAGLRGRFEAADGASVVDEPGIHCCYAKGDKHWVTDPQGIAWEAFHTLESVPFFGAEATTPGQATTCCRGDEAAPAQTSAAGASPCCR